eukprot:TRINITY_DN41515_c0_g1_i2.p2 TRINITY_DN41515_c0_g1~~TRINITY_DN41515_c0_g1_i2.p2  ORF type:complete len:538 (-),score=140.41 TRINITY_DN41515_c0_g1_i2:33-1646(-)
MASDAADIDDRGHLYGFGDPNAKRTKLQEIVEQRVLDVEEAKAKTSADDLKQAAKKFEGEHGAPLNLSSHLDTAEKSAWSLALAAEFKRASPSKGDINAGLDAAAQALEYTRSGASILSVLTEPKWFKGTLADLRDVRLKTQQWATQNGRLRPACLRKDFVIDEYQVLEALAHGADTVLLMVSILSKSKLRHLITFCDSHRIVPLVEVVTSAELKVAMEAGARVLGVNNRNLHTFELDKGRTAQIAKELEESYKVTLGQGGAVKLLALSGLSTADDVDECRKLRCSGVLIGETLMRAADPGAAIVDLMEAGAKHAALPVAPGAVVVKVCGVKRPSDAEVAISAGANLVGVIFAKSKRQASTEDAKAVVAVVRKFGERTDRVLCREKNGNVETLTARSEALRRACKRTPLVVGVFMDQALEELVAKSTECSVDAVQLHGGEDPAFVEEVKRRLPGVWVLKVVHLPPKGDGASDGGSLPAELMERLKLYSGPCDALLLDTAVKGSNSGGTGAAFDWTVARRVQVAFNEGEDGGRNGSRR